MTRKTRPSPWRRSGTGRGSLSLFPRLFLSWAGIALAWPAAGPGAELYRWTDAEGVTVYSQRPPPGSEATRLTPDRGPSPEESQRALRRLRTLAEQDLDRREEAQRHKQESRERAEGQARRQANCEAARKNLATLEDPRVARVRSAGGEPQALTDETRARYLEAARKTIQESCD